MIGHSSLDIDYWTLIIDPLPIPSVGLFICLQPGFGMRRRIWLSITIGSLLAGGSGNSPTGPSGPPVVADVNGATLPSGPTGSTILIEGSGFGSTQATATGKVLFSNGTGGTVTATIASASDWGDTFIITTVPAGAATGNLV